MLDVNRMRLDDIRLANRDPRPIPTNGIDLELQRLSFYDSWDQWLNEMERPIYADHLFEQGLSYVYGVCIRLLRDGIPEPAEFYLGAGKPSQVITLRSGGLQ